MTVMVAPVAEAEAEWETVVEAPTAGAVAKMVVADSGAAVPEEAMALAAAVAVANRAATLRTSTSESTAEMVTVEVAAGRAPRAN